MGRMREGRGAAWVGEGVERGPRRVKPRRDEGGENCSSNAAKIFFRAEGNSCVPLVACVEGFSRSRHC